MAAPLWPDGRSIKRAASLAAYSGTIRYLLSHAGRTTKSDAQKMSKAMPSTRSVGVSRSAAQTLRRPRPSSIGLLKEVWTLAERASWGQRRTKCCSINWSNVGIRGSPGGVTTPRRWRKNWRARLVAPAQRARRQHRSCRRVVVHPVGRVPGGLGGSGR